MQPSSGDALGIAPGTGGGSPAAIDLLLALTGAADQTWSIQGDGNNGFGGVSLAGVTGPNAVHVTMSDGA